MNVSEQIERLSRHIEWAEADGDHGLAEEIRAEVRHLIAEAILHAAASGE